MFLHGWFIMSMRVNNTFHSLHRIRSPFDVVNQPGRDGDRAVKVMLMPTENLHQKKRVLNFRIIGNDKPGKQV